MNRCERASKYHNGGLSLSYDVPRRILWHRVGPDDGHIADAEKRVDHNRSR
jgi:hypothetical protein